MKKIIQFILISILIVFLFPINGLGQVNDFWLMEEFYQGEQEGQAGQVEQGTGEEIYLNSIDLYWSTDTYVPADYPGRPLPVKGSMVFVFVDIKVSGENPLNLKYSWFLDGIFQETKPGYGKDSFQFGVRRYEGATHEVLLKVFNESRSFLIERSIEIPVASPEIAIYPLYSLEKGSFSMQQTNKKYFIVSGQKYSFIAKPFFFSVKKLTDLTFKWSLSNERTVTSSNFNANILDLVVKKEEKQPLESEVKLDVNDNIGIGQKASQKINIQIY